MKCFRVSLRLTFLIVALFSVFFAWVGSQREMQRIRIRAELDDLEHIRRYLATSPITPGFDYVHEERVRQINEDIAEKRRLLGE